ncbi:methyltransferase domain-containing protein [Luteithermobacter gelatinilyticus]|uniref:methyltransferase domain-containing protein n=1 Tax=Luteithermobacter gelatinilyticus TaxID=2582913 RepID=UPI0011064C4F|nr:methyltransferase domain-containing protein [Luteithermobacter gelatinilyticus]
MSDEISKTVRDRYASGARQREAELCCPVEYDRKYLDIIPEEVIERDYGCGDPSRYIRKGDVVLDLGSGGGKICFIASQVTGPEGRVIGVDMTDEMLDLARRNAPIVAERLGYANVEFRKGLIQDMKTDMDKLQAYLKDHPVSDAAGYVHLQEEIARLRREAPLIEDNSVDIIVSNCVLNLVSDDQKRQLFREMYRVLKKGGRIAISDIVSDEASPEHLKNDPELWSGCISGALQEHEFIRLLEETGFYGVTIDKLEDQPWQVVEGIEYRSMTVLAWKGKEGPCYDKNHAVIYKGPWKVVQDDDGHTFYRGQRMAVCEKTFNIMTGEPYKDHIIAVPPRQNVTEEVPFSCEGARVRSPRETKAGIAPVTTDPGPSGCC